MDICILMYRKVKILDQIRPIKKAEKPYSFIQLADFPVGCRKVLNSHVRIGPFSNYSTVIQFSKDTAPIKELHHFLGNFRILFGFLGNLDFA